jgi:hypothetical protein
LLTEGVDKRKLEKAKREASKLKSWLLFLGSRRGRKRQEVGTKLKEVKVGYVI